MVFSLFPTLPKRVQFGSYPYTYARVSAMKGNLLKEHDYQKLLKMEMAEIAKSIQEGEYKKEIDQLAVKYSGVHLLTKALDAHFFNVAAKMRRISTAELTFIIDAYLKRNDIANLKTILRGKAAGMSSEAIQEQFVPGGTLPSVVREQLCQADTPEGLLGQMIALGIPELKQVKDIQINEGMLAAAEHLLDTTYYTYLLTLAQRCEQQGKFLIEFLQAEVDNKNLFALLRLKHAGVPKEEIGKQFLPAGRKYSRKQLLDWASLSLEELHTALAKKGISLEGGVTKFEVQETRSLLGPVALLLHSHPLSVEVILGFLFAKEVEMRNLRMLIMGKHLNIDPEFMESNLVVG